MTDIAAVFDWSGPLGLPDFSRIDLDGIAAAIQPAMAQAGAEIEEIAGQSAAPGFDNTIGALERAGARLERAATLLFTLAGVDATDAVQALQEEVAPRLAAFDHRVKMNADLFARIEALWTNRDSLELSGEQTQLLARTRRGFIRAGAQLDARGRQRMGEIAERLAALGVAFSRKVLRDEKAFALPVPEAIAGAMPGFLRDAMADAAQERGREGYVATLNRSLIEPFLSYCPDRALREQAFGAWIARGTGHGVGGSETDTAPEIAETLALRREKARLLGYDDYPAFKLAHEMAGGPEPAEALLRRVWIPARARAADEAEKLAEIMAEEGANHALEGWDWRYYAEKLRAREFDLSEAELKPYLSLDAMIEAAFDTARRLFGLSFKPVEGANLWAPDLRVWRVMRDGAEMGVFIGDYFARPTKRSGAWCSALRDQQNLEAEIRPIVLNVLNVARGGETTLLSWDDAHTLFHEFGHALHQLLSDVTYPSLSGTSVARDFVELPSQLYEHWLTSETVLAAHARHVETGEAMPQALIDKVRAAEVFNQGYATSEFVQSALIDLAMHRAESVDDPFALEREVRAALDAPRAIPPRHAAGHFQHVFSGEGYASGYYSYMWSEVMDADAFAAFEETGDPFDSDTAARLETEILSRGGSVEAEDAWIAFRGRAPDPDAMLKKRGLSA